MNTATVRVNGTALHCVRDGAGDPPLLFVHGYTCANEDWRGPMQALRDRHAVVACDLRGHGRTRGEPADCSIETYGADVSALLSALGPGPEVLVGHSMGCRVVLEAYRTAPARVAGIVLVDGSYQGAAGLPAVEKVRADIAATGYAAFVEELFAGMFLAPTDDAKDVMNRARRMPEAIGAALFPRMVAWDATQTLDALAAVRCPLLVVQSTYLDNERRRRPLAAGQTSPWLDLVRERAPHARIEVIAGSGHFPMLDRPAEFNALIADFAAGLSR